MKGQALRPDFFTSQLPQRVADAEKEGATEEERHLYNLSRHKGWKILSEFIDEQVQLLENLQSQAIASGMDMQQVGYNAIVIDQVKKIVKSVSDRVQDAKEACENPDGTSK